MNWTIPSLIEVKLGQITRAQRKKLKLQEENGMITYMEEGLKSKNEAFEVQEKTSKMFTNCSIIKDQSMEQLEMIFGYVWEAGTLLLVARTPLLSPVDFCWGN